MPQVARYGQRRVGTAALPGVRKTAAETPLSEGAGVQQAKAQRDQAIAGLAGTAASIGLETYSSLKEKSRVEADQTALLEAGNRLSEWENDRLYNPNGGALTKKGKDALDLPTTVLNDYETVTNDIASGLSTDSQRQAFAKMRVQRRQDIDLTIKRHVFGEMQAYKASELDAFVGNASNLAVQNAQDPARVGIELNRAVDAIKQNAPALGMGKEAVDAKVAQITTQTHVGVIDRLLSLEKPEAAKVYYEETQSQISGDAQARIEKALKAGSARKEAQKQSDAIIAAGGTLTEQREKARQIDDPDVRDEVMSRIEHENAVADKVRRDTEEETLRGAFDIVDRTHNVARIPPATWATLDGSARSALRNYSESLSRGIPVKTDLPTFYGLMRQAADDPQAFAEVNLLSYRDKLDEGEFKQMAGMQLAIRNRDTKKADETLAPFRTRNQVLEDSLTLYGIDPNVKRADDKQTYEAVAQLRRMLDTRVDALEATTGKKASNADIQAILDGLLSTTTEGNTGNWWALWMNKKAPKPIIETTIADVPPGDKQQIIAKLKAAGRPTSDANILSTYIEILARIRK